MNIPFDSTRKRRLRNSFRIPLQKSPFSGSTRRLSKVHPAGGGFTLVECALALAIMTAGLAALLGVLPVALGSSRTAMDATCRANIGRQIASEYEKLPFDTIDTAGQVKYFSDQGLEVPLQANARFQVLYRAATNASLFGTTNNSLKPVIIQIFLAFGPTNQGPLSTVTTLVADNGIRATKSQ